MRRKDRNDDYFSKRREGLGREKGQEAAQRRRILFYSVPGVERSETVKTGVDSLHHLFVTF